MPNGLAVSELAHAGIALRPAQAVALVAEVCRLCLEGRVPGVASESGIRITADGDVEIRGPGISREAAVTRAANLLNALLPAFDAAPEYRAAGGLRLVIARALGTLDLPPYASLEEFRGALARFAPPDTRDAIRSVFRDWERAQAAAAPVGTAGRVFNASRPARSRRGLRYAAVAAVPVGAAALLTLIEAERPNAGAIAARPRPSQAIAAGRASTVSAPGSRPLVQAAFSPTFARGGTAVYFHPQRDGASSPHRADTDGRGDAIDVTGGGADRARNFHPRRSPDGSRIAVDSDRDGTRAVFIANADGSDARRVSGAGFAAVPAWSPDGTRLAFVRAEPRASQVWNLWIVDADGSNLKRLTNHRVGQARGGSWFPDGRAIAYSVEARLVVLDLVTGARHTFDSPRRGYLARTPAVAPDGRRIIFQVHRNGVWVVDVQSGAMRRVLSDPTAEEFTWSPDGLRVSFRSYRTGEWSIWEMAL